jgi:hypothetical protein
MASSEANIKIPKPVDTSGAMGTRTEYGNHQRIPKDEQTLRQSQRSL